MMYILLVYSTYRLEAIELEDKSKLAPFFYKNNKTDKIWWLDNTGTVEDWIFSFDKKKLFNMFADYPHNLTKEQREIFDKENPYWMEFFKDRQR